MKRQTSFSDQDEAVGFYDEQSRLLGDRMHKAEKALQSFYEQEGIIGGPDERKNQRDRLTEVRGSLAKTDTELAETKVRVEFLKRALPGVPREVRAKEDAGGTLRTQLVDLMVQ